MRIEIENVSKTIFFDMRAYFEISVFETSRVEININCDINL